MRNIYLNLQTTDFNKYCYQLDQLKAAIKKRNHQSKNKIFQLHLELPDPHFSDVTQFRIVYMALCWMTYLPPYIPFPKEETSQAKPYFHSKCLATSSDYCCQDKPCYVHRTESYSFPLYSFEKDFLESFPKNSCFVELDAS